MKRLTDMFRADPRLLAALVPVLAIVVLVMTSGTQEQQVTSVASRSVGVARKKQSTPNDSYAAQHSGVSPEDAGAAANADPGEVAWRAKAKRTRESANGNHGSGSSGGTGGGGKGGVEVEGESQERTTTTNPGVTTTTVPGATTTTTIPVIPPPVLPESSSPALLVVVAGALIAVCLGWSYWFRRRKDRRNLT